MSVSLNSIVDVEVEVSKTASIVSDFNLGMIIGNSTVLLAANRVKVYNRDTFSTQMVSDGFQTTSKEYIATSKYFSQNSSAAEVAIGAKIDSETDVQAITNCRAFNEDAYGICFCYDVKANIQEIAAAVESFATPTVFFYQTDDENCITASQDNIMKTLKDKNYARSVGFYSTQEYFISGVLGLFSGLNSMQANSAYTLAFKNVVGFNPESINDIQISALKSYNGNVYTTFGRRYNFIVPGIVASGLHVDTIFLMDAARFLIQQNTIAGLVSRRVVPQNEDGLNSVITFITAGCETLRSMGVISTGIWTGGQVLDLAPGDAIQNGYLIQAESFANQSASDREARLSPPIYVALKASGAVEHVVVRVFVNQ